MSKVYVEWPVRVPSTVKTEIEPDGDGGFRVVRIQDVQPHDIDEEDMISAMESDELDAFDEACLKAWREAHGEE